MLAPIRRQHSAISGGRVSRAAKTLTAMIRRLSPTLQLVPLWLVLLLRLLLLLLPLLALLLLILRLLLLC